MKVFINNFIYPLQSTQAQFPDVGGLDEDLLPDMVDDEEIADDITGLNDLFSDWDQEMIQPTSPDRSSRPGSPGMDELMGQRNSPGLPSSNGGQKPQQDTEEVS